MTIAPRPLATVAATAAKPVLGENAIVERANAALNGVTSLTAEFTQIGGDGRRLTGTLYLQRPGKVRFEYDKPSTLEVVSDGTTVLVRDRKLNTSDPYPIGQTPLKFLLSSRIDLTREANVKSVQTDPDGVRITVEDTTTLGGTSKITLSFNPDVTLLTRWRVVDPQGYTTTVSLANQDRNKPIDSKVFMLNYMRPVD
jgi:outer membrane lipoprotein-sorting protein